MPAIPLWGFIDTIFEAVDWTKLVVIPSGALAIFSVAFLVSSRLAKHKVSIQLNELESKVRSETEAHRAAIATIESLRLQQATHAVTMESHWNTIKLNETQLAQKQAEYAKVFTAGQKVYKELLILREVKKEHDRLQVEHRAKLAEVKRLEDHEIGQDEKLRLLRDDLELREKELAQSARRMQKARSLRGYLLKAKALQARPRFRALAERNRAIIAIAALKGGVGKTTLTAHLAGAFARKGYRVLLVDLDLQGSLSGLMLPPDVIYERFKKKRLVQDFFVKAMEHKFTKLSEFIVRSPQSMGCPGSIDIVPASDQLAYAELNLTLGWLLKRGERDARFLLRRALHLKGPNAPYDLVLLDCPPLLNISCANALAASDFVLIPTLLSAKSTERVPNLIHAVQDEPFVKHLNSHLRVLGVVANRSRYSEPKGSEAVNWNANLPQSLAAIQNQHTKLFTTIIAQDAEISSSEELYTHPKPGGRAADMFAQLLTEVEKELPNACRRTAPPPA